MGIIFRRKKQNIVDNEHDELIKRLDEIIKWIKEKQKKSEEEKLVSWVTVDKEKKVIGIEHLESNYDIKNCYFTTVE